MLFLLVILALSLHLSPVRSDQPYVSKCDLTDPKYLKPVIVQEWCYFVVKGATKEANPTINSTHYIFDVGKAREICKKVQATLPIVNSKDDHKIFFDNYFRDVDGWPVIEQVALGLQQFQGADGYHYLWDDGTNLTSPTYTDEAWNKKESALYTVIQVNSPSYIGWKNHKFASSSLIPIGVVCQQALQQEKGSTSPTLPPTLPTPSSTPTATQTPALLTSTASTKPTPTSPTTPMPTLPSGPKSVCEQSKPNKFRYETWRSQIFNNESCYFVVKNATQNSNKEENGTYFFDIKKARKICERHNAHLPIIKSNDESKFFREKFGLFVDGGNGSAALGLVQIWIGLFVRVTYEWDDGTQLDYESVWPNKYRFFVASYTKVTLELGNDRFPAEWTNVHNKSSQQQPVNVICEQPLGRSKKTTSSPLPDGSRCALNDSVAYPKAAIFHGKTCYFLVANATIIANKRFGEEYDFDPWEARKICEREGATLPIVHSEDEHKFITSNFEAKYFDYEQKYPNSVEEIALALRQGNNVDVYNWIDGSPVSYKPKEWIRKEKYVALVVMNLSSLAWDNLANFVARKTPIGVLCRQPHVIKPPTTTPKLTPIPTSTLTTPRSKSTPTPTLTPKSLTSPTLSTKPISTPTQTPTPPRLPTGPLSVCELSKPNKLLYETWRSQIFNNESCYFVVKNATQNSNREKEGDYFFDLKKAREICRRHKATLPIITSNDESRFFREKFNSFVDDGSGFAALGLRQDIFGLFVTFVYKWDDGTELDYEGMFRSKFDVEASYTKITIDQDDIRSPVEWTNVYVNINRSTGGELQPVHVICEQPLGYYKKPIAPPLSNRSKCEIGDSATYPETALFEGRTCYFVVANATTTANKLFGDEYDFDPWEARKICERQGATLPIIDSEDEHLFIMTNIAPEQYDHAKKFPKEVEEIALALRQGTNTDNYKWVDGAPINYEPKEWVRTNEYVPLVVMKLGSTAWVNLANFVGRKTPIGVLCRQVLKLPTTTTKRTTTPETRTTTKTTAKPDWPIFTYPPPPDPPLPTPPLPPSGNKCAPQNKNSHLYSMTAPYGGQELCYFVVNGASLSAITDIRFDIHKARQICKKHNATLPIIFKEEEAKFILRTFKAKHFGKGLTFVGIALGMHVSVIPKQRYKRFGYTWDDNDDNTEVIYEPRQWIEEGNYVYYSSKSPFVIMEFESEIVWKTYASGDHSRFVAVLCQQVIGQRSLPKARGRYDGAAISNRPTIVKVFIAIILIMIIMLACSGE